MDKVEKMVAIGAFVRAASRTKHRVGRTLVHKAFWLAQDLMKRDMGFGFGLWRYGPFAPPLEGELDEMEAIHLLEVVPDPEGYGRHHALSEGGERLVSQFGERIKDGLPVLEFLAEKLAPLTVKELEALATCQYFRHRLHTEGWDAYVRDIRNVKPHLSEEDISSAVAQLDRISQEAKSRGLLEESQE